MHKVHHSGKLLILRQAITGQVLLDQIAGSGAFDAGLVERYPQAFVGRAGNFCGDVVVHARRGGLVGTFKDCINGKTYPLEYQQTTNNDLAFYENHLSILSWFNGRFERRSGKIIFIAVPDMEAEAWWKQQHTVQ